jgi:hypothetical protein
MDGALASNVVDDIMLLNQRYTREFAICLDLCTTDRTKGSPSIVSQHADPHALRRENHRQSWTRIEQEMALLEMCAHGMGDFGAGLVRLFL